MRVVNSWRGCSMGCGREISKFRLRWCLKLWWCYLSHHHNFRWDEKARETFLIPTDICSRIKLLELNPFVWMLKASPPRGETETEKGVFVGEDLDPELCKCHPKMGRFGWMQKGERSLIDDVVQTNLRLFRVKGRPIFRMRLRNQSSVNHISCSTFSASLKC